MAVETCERTASGSACGGGCLQLLHERDVLRRSQTLLQDALHCGEVAAEQGRRREPETGEDVAAVDAIGTQRHANELTLSKDEVIELAFEDAPDDVLPHAVAAVDVQLRVKVVAGGAHGDLNY